MEVPRIGLPTVERAPLPGVRQSPDTKGAFSPVQPVDLSAVRGALLEVQRRERAKADQIAITEADGQLAAIENELLFNPETGILNRKGKDSFSAPEDVNTEWNKRVSELVKTLNTDEQRLKFSQRAAQRYESLSTTVQRHVYKEREVFDAGVTESYLENERNSAMANFTDPARIAVSIQRQTETIVEFGKRNGWSPEKVKAKVDDEISKTHTGVVNLMLAAPEGGDLMAFAYVKEHKGEIKGADSVAVARALEEGSTRGESQRKADAITQKFDNRADALVEAAKIKDPKVRDATEARVNNFYSAKRAIRQEVQEDLYLRATNMMDANPGAPARQVVPPHIWSKLELGQRTALENRGEGGGNLVNNDRKWLQFLDMRPMDLGALSQAQFETSYWSHFDKEHRERAATQWAAARDALKTGQFAPGNVSTITFNDRVLNTIRIAELVNPSKESSKWNKSEVKMAAQFETEASKRVNEANAQLGKGQRLGGIEIQEILDALVMERLFLKKPGFDKEVLMLQVEEDDKGRAYKPYDQIPVDKRNELITSMKTRGTKQTKDKVERAYAALLLRDAMLLESILREK